jgi:hypothetical protein
MFVPDLNRAVGAGFIPNGCAAIGWLSSANQYMRGTTSESFIRALRRQLLRPWKPLRDWGVGGPHRCELCPPNTAPASLGEFLIPSKQVVYAVPLMLLHYVTAHEYLPPAEFQIAVEECPLPCSPEFMTLLSPHFEMGLASSYSFTNPISPDEYRRLSFEHASMHWGNRGASASTLPEWDEVLDVADAHSLADARRAKLQARLAAALERNRRG